MIEPKIKVRITFTADAASLSGFEEGRDSRSVKGFEPAAEELILGKLGVLTSLFMCVTSTSLGGNSDPGFSTSSRFAMFTMLNQCPAWWKQDLRIRWFSKQCPLLSLQTLQSQAICLSVNIVPELEFSSYNTRPYYYNLFWPAHNRASTDFFTWACP